MFKRGQSEGIWQTEVPSGVQGQSPYRETGDSPPEARGGLKNLRKGAGPSHSLPLPFFSPFLFSLPLRSLAPYTRYRV